MVEIFIGLISCVAVGEGVFVGVGVMVEVGVIVAVGLDVEVVLAVGVGDGVEQDTSSKQESKKIEAMVR
jgi:hypothetical protein